MTDVITFQARVARKQDDLPRFVVVPVRLLTAWQLDATTPVELTINGREAARRTIKRWDEAKWFLSITNADCNDGGFDTGDTIEIAMRRASTELPDELTELLASEPRPHERWQRLTTARQRMLAEEIRAAKKSETRASRARKQLLPD